MFSGVTSKSLEMHATFDPPSYFIFKLQKKIMQPGFPKTNSELENRKNGNSFRQNTTLTLGL